MNEFKSPYIFDERVYAGPTKNVCRAPADIGREDYLFIKGIRPLMGTVNTTQSILWSRLCDALRKAGIVDNTSQLEFESFVAHIQIIDGRKASVKKKKL